MSLNDPHWGRGPAGGESDDSKRAQGADGSQQPDDGVRGQDEKNERSGRRDQDDHGERQDGYGRDDRGYRDDRDDRDGRGGRDRRSDDGEDDLDRLWREFTELFRGPGSRSNRRSPDDPLSHLKSRDDFSRDDDQADRSSERDDRYGRDDRAGGQDTRGERDDRSYGRDDRDDRNDERRRGVYNGRPLFTIKIPGMGGGAGSGKKPGFGAGLLGLVIVLGWAASGFYIVPEGQTGVETTFGRYSNSTMPGFHWHIPMPVQDVELVDVSSVRTATIGAGGTDRLREALMLTDDENIVDVQFTVQYRIKSGDGAKDFLFNTRAPDMAVTQAAESAMREVVGRKAMDSVLFESKAEIAEAVKKSMQTMLDRYGTGIEVMSVAILNAQPPQQVQAAFNDAVKAGQDRERAINLGEAYMNSVIPKAKGSAARLKEEAEGYKARVTEVARGDADRFKSIYAEYEKAPQVTRDRLYVDAMRDIYTSVTKIYVDQKSGSSLLYLPLDKIVSQTQAQAAAAAAATSGDPSLGASANSSAAAGAQTAPAAGTSNTNGATYRTEDDPRAMIRSRVR